MASAIDKISTQIELKTLWDAVLKLRKDDTITFRRDGRLLPEHWYTEIVARIFKIDINSFVRAKVISQSIASSDLNYAFIYRRDDLKDYQKQYKKAFLIIEEDVLRILKKPDININMTGKIQDILRKRGSEILGSTPLLKVSYGQCIKKIVEDKTIEKILTLSSEKRESETQKHFKEYYKKAENLAGEAFFKESNLQAVRHKNAIYHPDVYHSWGTNLVWLLANIKKGNRFIIRSDIGVKGNILRSDPKVPGELSAFAREICAVLNAGYELCREGSDIFLQPSTSFDASLCDTDGRVGNGINHSNFDVRFAYGICQVGLLRKGDFQCSKKQLMEEFELYAPATSFTHLCATGAINTIEILVEMNFSYLGTKDWTGSTPLMHAVMGSHLEVVRFLIKKKIDINEKNYFANTAILIAAKQFDYISKNKTLYKNKDQYKKLTEDASNIITALEQGADECAKNYLGSSAEGILDKPNMPVSEMVASASSTTSFSQPSKLFPVTRKQRNVEVHVALEDVQRLIEIKSLKELEESTLRQRLLHMTGAEKLLNSNADNNSSLALVFNTEDKAREFELKIGEEVQGKSAVSRYISH